MKKFLVGVMALGTAATLLFTSAISASAKWPWEKEPCKHNKGGYGTHYQGSCYIKEYYTYYCAACGEYRYTMIYDYVHCYTTDPYKAPTCIYCGHKK